MNWTTFSPTISDSPRPLARSVEAIYDRPRNGDPRNENVRGHRPPLQVRVIASCLLIFSLVVVCGCAPKEPAIEPEMKPTMSVAQSAPSAEPTLQPVSASIEPQLQVLEGSGQTVWAPSFVGQLIAGLDGALYEPYHSGVIERIQRILKERGIYAGSVNGVLDAPTMKAIYVFQEANYDLQVCGVPTPRTRKLLEQGSHTDPG